jgi:hypothetical protein
MESNILYVFLLITSTISLFQVFINYSLHSYYFYALGGFFLVLIPKKTHFHSIKNLSCKFLKLIQSYRIYIFDLANFILVFFNLFTLLTPKYWKRLFIKRS